MHTLTFVKAVSVLPSPLTPSTVYLVRVGAGFDLYVTDATGATAVAPNEPTRTQIIDNRNANYPPSWYWQNHPRTLYTEFKYASVVSLQRAKDIGQTFVTMTSQIQWGDPTGGKIIQRVLFENGEVWFRTSVGTDGWTGWAKSG